MVTKQFKESPPGVTHTESDCAVVVPTNTLEHDDENGTASNNTDQMEYGNNNIRTGQQQSNNAESPVIQLLESLANRQREQQAVGSPPTGTGAWTGGDAQLGFKKILQQSSANSSSSSSGSSSAGVVTASSVDTRNLPPTMITESAKPGPQFMRRENDESSQKSANPFENVNISTVPYPVAPETYPVPSSCQRRSSHNEAGEGPSASMNDAGGSGPTCSYPQQSTANVGVQPSAFPQTAEADIPYLTNLILDIPNPKKRDFALQELGKHRESYPNLAPCLWYSFGTIAAFLQEIISVYPKLNPPVLSETQSHRVCNCLALLQCIASHEETKALCLKANIPLFLYPFLNSVSKHRSLEYLRLTALGVIGALIKGEDTQVLSFLLRTEIVPLCLRIMDAGTELSKTVATFIVQRILIHDKGLAYLCATPERFYAVSSVLAATLNNQTQKPRTRLVKHVIRCYLRLCDDGKARLAFKHCLPECLKNGSLAQHCKEDPVIETWLTQLLTVVNQVPPPPPNAEVGEKQLEDIIM